MSTTKKLTNITTKQITDKGVQALANRPNAPGQYGAGGLSPTQLKLWFDKLATFLAEKVNELQDTISSNEAAKYIRVMLDDYAVENLNDLVLSFVNGSFAENILKLYPSASTAQAKSTLQAVINNIAAQISGNLENIAKLDSKKLDKVVSTNTYKRAYIIMPDGTQATMLISESAIEGQLPVYTTGGRLKVNDPVYDGQAVNKRTLDDKAKTLGCKVEMSVDPNTYVVSLKLKNSADTVLSTTTIDLPLESVVAGGSYDEETKEVVLRLDNDNVIRFSVADLIDGLVSVAVYEQGIAEATQKINKNSHDITAVREYMATHSVYSGFSMYAEEADVARNYTRGGAIDKALRNVAAGNGISIALSMDSDYKLTISLKNKKGVVISSGMVDLPIESLITRASYSNKILTLTFQSGDTLDINISSIVSGLVPETRKVNGKVLSSDITLTADDVGAVAKVTKTDGIQRVFLDFGDGRQGTQQVSTSALEYTFVQRALGGHLFVPLVPTEKAHAVSMYYVDKVASGGDTKVDKLDVTPTNEYLGAVYAQYFLDGAVTEGYVHFAQEAKSGTIPTRASGGYLLVPLVPTEKAHAASKHYVDKELEEIKERLSELEKQNSGTSYI